MTFYMVGSDMYMVSLWRLKKRLRNSFSLPTFTVIVPAHNEELTVENAIISLVNTHYSPKKLQIIVADDGSTDATARIIDECIARFPSHAIQRISRPNAGKAHALNYAIRTHACGELLMCLDADSTLEPRALLNAARHFTDERVVALSANVKIRPTKSLFNLIQRFEYFLCYRMKRAQTYFNIEYIIGGIGSTFRRSTLEQVGLYDTDTVTEDIDLTMKFLQLGNKNHKVIYGSDVVAYTESVLTLNGLIRQRFRWKWGRGQTFEKNWDLFFSRHNKHARALTWVHLPFALFSDLAFFFEPFMLTYIFYIIVRYGDLITLGSAFIVTGVYIFLNILAEDTIRWGEKIKLLLIAPSMYFFFYILSVAEYVALIKTYFRYGKLRKSLSEKMCSWQHVERARV